MMSNNWRKFWTIVLGVVFVLAFAVFVLGLVIRRDLLAPELYTTALSENDVYDRVYTELLADPAVQEQFKEMTGIDMTLINEPDKMESAAGQFFSRLTAYIAGETPELPENLELGSALTPEVLADRIVRAATAVTVEAVDKTTPIVEAGTEALAEAELLAYLDEVSQGRLGPIPRRLIRASTKGLAQLDGERIVNLMLGPAADTAGEETLLQMEAALVADDMPGAIALAVTERLKLLVTNRLAAAEPRLAETQALVGLSGAAAQLGQTRDQVVGTLNTVRGYAELLQRLMLPLVLLMLLCIVLIVWLNAHDLRSTLSATGWTLVAASGVVMGLWLIGGLILRSVLRAKLAAAVIGPAGLDSIIDDVVGSLGRRPGQHHRRRRRLARPRHLGFGVVDRPAVAGHWPAAAGLRLQQATAGLAAARPGAGVGIQVGRPGRRAGPFGPVAPALAAGIGQRATGQSALQRPRRAMRPAAERSGLRRQPQPAAERSGLRRQPQLDVGCQVRLDMAHARRHDHRPAQ